jgi:hypothetical protein
VPIGVGLAGVTVPALIAVMPWTWALGVLALACVALAAALGPAGVLERRVPAERVAAASTGAALRAPLGAALAPLGRVWFEPALRLMAVLGLTMAGSATLLGLLPTDGPRWTLMAAALACAATSMALNGVCFAELADRVRAEEFGELTGGTQFLTFCGAMAGPVGFASLVGVTGSHGATYVVMAVAPFAVGVWLWMASARD